MKCEYCGEVFQDDPTRKVIRGKRHIFCSEMCYRFHHYRVPKHDMQKVIGEGAVRVYGIPDFGIFIDEENEKKGVGR